MMTTVTLMALFIAGASIGENPSPTPQAGTPEIEVWLSRTEGLVHGDPVRVYLRTRNDGHVVVLHADPDGRIRVLYPLDPVGDDFVRAGREYEVRDREGRPAIEAVDAAGFGTIVAAWSADPFRYEGFGRGDHWDHRLLGEIEVRGDAEAELVGLAQQMASGAAFVYDLQTYYSGGTVARAERVYRRYGLRYGPHPVHTSVSVRLGFGFGPWPHRYYRGRYWGPVGLFAYHDPFYYDPFYYDPFFYDPFYYDPFYYRTRFGGYGRGGFYPYGPIVVYAGPRVNRRYTTRGRGVDGMDYRDRRLTTPGTLYTRRVAPTTRRRTPVVAATPRRAGTTTVAAARRPSRVERPGRVPTRRVAPRESGTRVTEASTPRRRVAPAPRRDSDGRRATATPTRRPTAGEPRQPPSSTGRRATTPRRATATATNPRRQTQRARSSSSRREYRLERRPSSRADVRPTRRRSASPAAPSEPTARRATPTSRRAATPRSRGSDNRTDRGVGSNVTSRPTPVRRATPNRSARPQRSTPRSRPTLERRTPRPPSSARPASRPSSNRPAASSSRRAPTRSARPSSSRRRGSSTPRRRKP